MSSQCTDKSIFSETDIGTFIEEQESENEYLREEIIRVTNTNREIEQNMDFMKSQFEKIFEKFQFFTEMIEGGPPSGQQTQQGLMTSNAGAPRRGPPPPGHNLGPRPGMNGHPMTRAPTGQVQQPTAGQTPAGIPQQSRPPNGQPDRPPMGMPPRPGPYSPPPSAAGQARPPVPPVGARPPLPSRPLGIQHGRPSFSNAAQGPAQIQQVKAESPVPVQSTNTVPRAMPGRAFLKNPNQ